MALRVTFHLPTPILLAETSIFPVLVKRESHLIDALHPVLFQVRLGTQEVGVLGVVRRLLEIDIDAICGAECRHWLDKTGSTCYYCCTDSNILSLVRMGFYFYAVNVNCSIFRGSEVIVGVHVLNI